jgi:hypothetical protein
VVKQNRTPAAAANHENSKGAPRQLTQAQVDALARNDGDRDRIASRLRASAPAGPRRAKESGAAGRPIPINAETMAAIVSSGALPAQVYKAIQETAAKTSAGTRRSKTKAAGPSRTPSKAREL